MNPETPATTNKTTSVDCTPDFLTKPQTAKALGVSVWTVDNYRAAGRLTPHYRAGKTRSIVTFTRQEVDTIRQELDAVENKKGERVRAKKEKQQQQKKTWDAHHPLLRVRLSEYHQKRLEDEAKAYGVTPTAHAQGLIRGALESELRAEIIALRSAVGEIKEENKSLKKALRQERKLLGEVARVLLQYAGLENEQAGAWVERNILEKVVKEGDKDA
jgi:hypothetical protein